MTRREVRRWSVPSIEVVRSERTRISPGGGWKGDLDERVGVEEVISLITFAPLGIAFLVMAVIEGGDLGFASGGFGFLACAAIMIRHLRSRMVVDRHGIELRRVFRRDVTIPWSTIDSVSLVPGPYPRVNEWSSVCVNAGGHRHWVNQVRRPSDFFTPKRRSGMSEDLWASVDDFARDLDRLAAELRSAPNDGA